MKRLTIFLLALLALLAAGCGGGSTSSKGSGNAESPAGAAGATIGTITIGETEFKLDPADVKLDKPGTYVFRGVNKSAVPHAIAVEGNGVDEDGPTVGPGKVSVLKVTLAKSGTYELYCPVDGHEQMGMKGTVTVGAAAGSTGGTSTGETETNDEGSGY